MILYGLLLLQVEDPWRDLCVGHTLLTSYFNASGSWNNFFMVERSSDQMKRLMYEVLKLLPLWKDSCPWVVIRWFDFRILDRIASLPTFSQRPHPQASSLGGSFSFRPYLSQTILLLSKASSINQTKSGLIHPRAWVRGIATHPSKGPGAHLQHTIALSPQSSSQKKKLFPLPLKSPIPYDSKEYWLLLKTKTLQESREGEFMAIDLLTQVGL